MTTRRIGLQNNSAHQRFTVSLGDVQVDVRLNWLTRFGYYSVDLIVDDEVIAAGRGLHPETDLLEGTDIPGELFIRGAQPTPQNLDKDNRLLYVEAE